MFWNKWKTAITENQKINELTFEVNKLKLELKDIQEQINKLEIKALESRKLYHRKLKELYGDEEIETKETKDIYKGVFLPE